MILDTMGDFYPGSIPRSGLSLDSSSPKRSFFSPFSPKRRSTFSMGDPKYVLASKKEIPLKMRRALEKALLTEYYFPGKGKNLILSHSQEAFALLLEQIQRNKNLSFQHLCIELINELSIPNKEELLAYLLLKPKAYHYQIAILLEGEKKTSLIPYLAYAVHLHCKYFGGYPYCAQTLISILGISSLPFLQEYLEGSAPQEYKQEILRQLELQRQEYFLKKEKKQKIKKEKEKGSLRDFQKWWYQHKQEFWNPELNQLWKKYLKIKKMGDARLELATSTVSG